MNQEPQGKIIDTIVQRIASLQSRGDACFPEGTFPSFRQNKFLRYHRADSNIFYTASVVFVLQQLRQYVPAGQQHKIDSITIAAVRNYPLYRNKDGLDTYNFWQTPKDGRVSGHFPNGHIFRRMEHFRLPDDIDDTALVYLTKTTSKEEVLWLKEKLKLHANLSAGTSKIRKVKNTFRHYRDLSVYSTWFGKNMAIEYDACALCNLMYMFEQYELPYNEFDTDTYQYLKGIIDRRELISNPFLVSHNYATSSLIVYHLARLLGRFSTTPLESSRQSLMEMALELFRKEKSIMGKVILQTSLLKLSRGNDFGNSLEIERCLNDNPSQDVNIPDPDFCYFLGPLLSSYEHPVLQWLAPFKITQMEWKCEAHEWVLILENIIERNKY